MANAQNAPGWLVPQKRINLPAVPQQSLWCAWAGVWAVFCMGCRHLFAIGADLPPLNGTTALRVLKRISKVLAK